MNHYDVLRLPRNASEQDIKKAYRRLVKKYHPDSQTQEASHEQIILVNAAYEVLSDPQRRRRYDQGQTVDEDLSPRESRNSQASRECRQGQRRSHQADMNRAMWLKKVYYPIATDLTSVIAALDGQIDHLAADLFDDCLMADFQAYLGEIGQCLDLCRQRLTSEPNPQSFAKIAAFLYYGLNHVEDALEELTTFTQGYDESCLHNGQELFRLTQDLLTEAAAIVQQVD